MRYIDRFIENLSKEGTKQALSMLLNSTSDEELVMNYQVIVNLALEFEIQYPEGY